MEIRNFLQERVKQVELMKTIEQIGSRAEKRNTKTDSTLLMIKVKSFQFFIEKYVW